MSIDPVHVGMGTTSGGAATAVVSGLTLNDIGVYVGIAVGLVGLFIQWYFGRRRNRLLYEQAQRDAEFHAARLAALRRDDFE